MPESAKRAVLEKLKNFLLCGKMGDDVRDDVMGDVIHLNTDEQNYSSEKIKIFQYIEISLSNICASTQ